MASATVGAIAIIALLVGGAGFIFAARPDVVSQPEVSTGCSAGQAAQNETAGGVFQCIAAGGTAPNLSKDFYQSGAGTSVSVTTSFADVLPQQTWTPMNLNGYTNFKMFGVVSFVNSVAPTVIENNQNGNVGGTSTPNQAYAVNPTAGNVLVAVITEETSGAFCPTPTVNSVTDTLLNSYTQAVAGTCQNSNTITSGVNEFIWYATSIASGADTVTFHLTGAFSTAYITTYQVTGVSTSGILTGTGASSCTTCTTITASTNIGALSTNSFTIGAMSFNQNGGSLTCTPTTGYTLTGVCSADRGVEHTITVTTKPTFVITQTSASIYYSMSAVSFGPSAQTLNFKTQYSTDGGSSWNDVSASTLSVSSTVTAAFEQSSYFAIAAGAKGDNLFRVEVDATASLSITLYKFGIETQP